MSFDESLETFEIVVLDQDIITLSIDDRKNFSELKYKIEIIVGIPYNLIELSIKNNVHSKPILDWVGIHAYLEENKIYVNVPTKWREIILKIKSKKVTIEEIEDFIDDNESDNDSSCSDENEDDTIFFILFVCIINSSGNKFQTLLSRYFLTISSKNTYTNRNIVTAICQSENIELLQTILDIDKELVLSLLDKTDDYSQSPYDVANTLKCKNFQKLINKIKVINNKIHLNGNETTSNHGFFYSPLLSRQKASLNITVEQKLQDKVPKQCENIEEKIYCLNPSNLDVISVQTNEKPSLQLPSLQYSSNQLPSLQSPTNQLSSIQSPTHQKVRRISQFRPIDMQVRLPLSDDEDDKNALLESGRGLQQLVRVESWRTKKSLSGGRTRRITVAGCMENHMDELLKLKEKLSMDEVEEENVKNDQPRNVLDGYQDQRLEKPWNAWKPTHRRLSCNSTPLIFTNGNNHRLTFEEWLEKKTIESKVTEARDQPQQKIFEEQKLSQESREKLYKQWMNETLKKKDEIKKQIKVAETAKFQFESLKKYEKQKLAKENYEIWLQQKYERELLAEEEKLEKTLIISKKAKKVKNKSLPTIKN